MICEVEDCDRPSKGLRPWCAKHIERWRRWGDPTEMHPRIKGGCAIDGCDRPHEGRGWCAFHYRRWREHGDPLWQPKKTRAKKPTLDRLLNNIDTSAGPDACWPWTGWRNARGYGHTSVLENGRRVGHGAHRVMYVETYGPVPDGLFVLHNCNNPPCCNPAHLRVGTQIENMADRQTTGAGYARGAAAPRAVDVPPEVVAAIRALYQRRKPGRGQVALAERFGLSRTTVQRILTRTDRWAESA